MRAYSPHSQIPLAHHNSSHTAMLSHCSPAGRSNGEVVNHANSKSLRSLSVAYGSGDGSAASASTVAGAAAVCRCRCRLIRMYTIRHINYHSFVPCADNGLWTSAHLSLLPRSYRILHGVGPVLWLLLLVAVAVLVLVFVRSLSTLRSAFRNQRERMCVFVE